MLLNCDVGEDSWESLDCKEIQPVHPKWNHPWIFIGKTIADAEDPILGPPDVKSWLIWKDPDAGKDWRRRRRGWQRMRWLDGITNSMDMCLSSGGWWRAGKPGVLQSMGLQRVRHDWATELNWTGESESGSVVSYSLWPHGLYSPWNSSGHNTGVGSLSLLQGIFLTQGLNLGPPNCGQILYQLSHKGSPDYWWFYSIQETWQLYHRGNLKFMRVKLGGSELLCWSPFCKKSADQFNLKTMDSVDVGNILPLLWCLSIW